MHKYTHHLGDYARKTAALTATSHGVYRLLLDYYYGSESPLPLDLGECCVIARAYSAAERAAVPKVLAAYFTKTDDGWRHDRAEEEIAAYRARAEHNREVGRKGGRPAGKANPEETRTVSPRVSSGFRGETLASSHRTPISDPTDRAPAAAPSDPVEVIFQVGVPLLTGAGVPEKNARSLLGKLRRDHGEAAVAAAVRRMAAERPSEPAAWISAALGKGEKARAPRVAAAVAWTDQLLGRGANARTVDGAAERLD